MFARLRLLGEAACDSVVAEVLHHRARWARRGTGEFYTFGAASYLDEAEAYERRAGELNPLLLARFAPLYACLRERLAQTLDAPVELAEGKAVPGFHVWGVPGIPTGAHASLHFDLQYQRLRWPAELRAGPVRALSFTLPLRLPRAGGGLSLWDVTHDRVAAFCVRAGFRGTLEDMLPLFEERHEAYAPGELVVHSGHVLHRIAPVPRVEPDDLRLTLQGHALWLGGAWQLYW